jgi:hypothetical protein
MMRVYTTKPVEYALEKSGVVKQAPAGRFVNLPDDVAEHCFADGSAKRATLDNQVIEPEPNPELDPTPPVDVLDDDGEPLTVDEPEE